MATAVENTSIASARERAASILYGNERPIPPVGNEYKAPAAAPVIAEYSVPVKEEPKVKPTLSGYYHIETARAPRPTQFRSYEPVYEPTMGPEPQVVRPVVDGSKVVEEAPVAVTSKAVKSEIDIELEEDTQYVVRFKTPTIIAAAALAVIFFLMAVLFIVNIVNLSASTAAVNKLLQEEQTLNQSLDQSLSQSAAIKDEVMAEIDANWDQYQDLSMHQIDPDSVTPYRPSATTGSSGGFFDWVCKALSGLFG